MPFFRKKPAADPEPAGSDDRRGVYREAPEESLAVALCVEGFGEAPGELEDLSARGAGVLVAFVHDPNLAPGDLVEARFGGGGYALVKAPARVARVEQVGETHLRYGLELLDDGSLLAQLDAFARRSFNRRNEERLPMRHRHLRIDLEWRTGRARATFGDLSEDGVGCFVARRDAGDLAAGRSVTFRFRLPGVRDPFEGAARVRHVEPVGERVLVGLDFVSEDRALARRRGELRDYIARRSDQADQLERNWDAP